MDNQAVSQPGTIALEPPSTVLNPETVKATSGGGAPPLNDDDGSIESVLENELASLREKDKAEPESKPDEDEKTVEAKDKAEAKDEEKAKDEKAEKPVKTRNEDGKFAKTEKVEGDKSEPEKAATAQETRAEERQSEGRKLPEPPARFLPKEKEAWGNVPNVVKSAIERVSREHETEVSQYRESHENWQKLAKFDQMAKQHNTSVSEAMERYTALDGLLSSNPIEGIRQVLATRGITPEQYANHVLSNPDAHRPQMPQATPDPAVNRELETVKEQLEEMRTQFALETIIRPFREDPAHPRYSELENDINFFLMSGKIPASLTPQEKLETAYDMAVRINPTSEVAAPQLREAPAANEEDRSAQAVAGRKSIRGAPSNGSDTATEEADVDLDTLLRKEMRRMRA